MDEIKINLENLTDSEREQLLSIIEKANKPKNKVWKPEHGEPYWYISGVGEIIQTYNAGISFDLWHIASGNCYQTEEEAKFAKEKAIVTQELQNYADEHNEHEFDWDDPAQYKYHIYYGSLENVVRFGFDSLVKRNDIYFSSKEIAEAAVEAVGEGRVLKYYLEVGDQDGK